MIILKLQRKFLKKAKLLLNELQPLMLIQQKLSIRLMGISHYSLEYHPMSKHCVSLKLYAPF